MKARNSALAIVAMLALSVIPLTSTAAAAPQDTVNPDAASYAAESGISLREADSRLAQQAAAGRLQERLELSGSGWYAGLWIEHRPDFRVVIYSTQADATGLAAAKSAAGLTISTEVHAAQHSYAELSAEVDRLVTLDQAKNPISLSIQVTQNRILATAPSAEALRERAAALGVAIPDSVAIEEATYYVVPTTIYAGFGLTACTAGFGVKQTGGTTRGTTTAGHCGNTQKYSNTNLPFVGQATVGSSDVQWHTPGSETVINRAVDGIAGGSTPLYRNVTSKAYRSGQALNSYVCAWGIENGYSCGYLTSNTSLPAAGSVLNPNATFMVLARAGVDMSDRGDSGGPVYAGESAWGIIHGCISTHPSCDDPALKDKLVYMASNYLEGGVGVTILTTP